MTGSEDIAGIARIAGALLTQAQDPIAAAAELSQAIELGRPVSFQTQKLHGVDHNAVSALAPTIAASGVPLNEAFRLGAVWALGRREADRDFGSWHPVVTALDTNATDFPRLTSETLIGLVNGAARTVRFASAYVDPPGLQLLEQAMRGAVARGVELTILAVPRLERSNAVEEFVSRLGQRKSVHVYRAADDGEFPHVKLLIADSASAYVGSANFTRGGLTSNLEVGAIVRGRDVAVLDKFFDMLLSRLVE